MYLVVKFFIFFLFTFSIAATKDSSNIIYGIVYDDETSQPLDKVNISIDQGQSGSFTNSSGIFTIEDIKQGSYNILISHVGYKEIKEEVNIPIDEMMVFRLTKSFYSRTPIMVTGIHTEKPLSESPIITEIINKSDIERYSSTTVLELLEKVIPNIKTYKDSHSATMSIQGLDSKYYLFLLNGNRFTGETTGNIDFSRINTTNIERIEILNGGASTSYGSGAIGGVINVITKTNNSPASLKLGSKYYSKNDDQRHWISLGASYNRINSLTELNYKASNGYSIDGEIIQNKFDDLSVSQNLKFLLFNNVNINLFGRFYSHDTEDYNYTNLRRDKYNDSQLVFNIDYQIYKNLTLDFNFNKNIYDKYTVFEALNDEERIRSTHHLNLINSNVYYQLNNSISFISGLEYNLEEFYSPNDLEFNPYAGYLGADTLKSILIKSYYFQTNLVHNNSIHVVGGLRYDGNNIFGNHIGPHLSILYSKLKSKVRMNASQNFKSPTLKELYMSWDHFGMFHMNGNARLKPERSHYFSISYELTDYKYNLTLKPYVHLVDDMILSVLDFEENRYIYKNIKSVNISGLDIYLKMQMSRLSCSSTISFLNAKDMMTSQQLEGTNNISINNNVSYNLLNNFGVINLNWKYISQTSYYNDSSTPDELEKFLAPIPEYNILNLSYNIKLSNIINCSFGIDNLINTAEVKNSNTLFPDTRYFINLNVNFEK